MQATGWRRTAPTLPYPDTYTTDKTELFEAMRLCCRALDLPPSCRFLLEQLVAVYGGEPIEGRILVWPSNDYLESRTGIAERTIRFALRRLIDLEVIRAKDSPNGKRYAQRDRAGRIILAYGFDLTPILHRVSEFRDRLIALEELRRDRARVFDEITINRRCAQETLGALLAGVSTERYADLSRELERLQRVTPRRSAHVDAHSWLEDWAAFRTKVEEAYLSATGGNIGRHKDRNTKTPESPCISHEKGVGAEVEPMTCRELVRSCPDAEELLGGIRSDAELIEQTSRYRGALGVSRDAWSEACEGMGVLMAGAVLIWCVQIQARPAPGATPVKNLGGYFRVMSRKVARGDIDLAELVRRRL